MRAVGASHCRLAYRALTDKLLHLLHGPVEPYQLDRGVGTDRPDDSDWLPLSEILAQYCQEFGLNPSDLCRDDFIRLTPRSSRPYGCLYAY